MTSAIITERIGQILELLSARRSVPAQRDSFTTHLEELFDVLGSTDRTEDRAQAEELIWALWCSNEDEDATRALQKATGALNRGSLEEARDILDNLIEDHPGWAEAWNKRATLHFIGEEDLASLDDILATLKLEPRHFGAICGFGQICLRQDDELSGRAAFQFALRINPGLLEVQDATRALEKRLNPILH